MHRDGHVQTISLRIFNLLEQRNKESDTESIKCVSPLLFENIKHRAKIDQINFEDPGVEATTKIYS